MQHNKLEKFEAASIMDNSETLATLDTHDTGQRQTKHTTQRGKLKRWATFHGAKNKKDQMTNIGRQNNTHKTNDRATRKVNIDKDDKIFVLIIIVQIILIFKLATSFLVCDHFDYMSFIKSIHNVWRYLSGTANRRTYSTIN
jgi:hypothetical protein